MTIFFTSDWHIGHKNILRYCDRGCETLDDMHEKLISNYNTVVGPKDTVFFMGDMAFGIAIGKKIISQLNGKKILIRGNHDSKPSAMINTGFDEVYERLDIIMFGSLFTLSHFPFRPTLFSDLKIPFWKRVLYGLEDAVRYYSRRPRNDGQFLLHGHTHSSEKFKDKMIHVGVDAWNMKPVSMSDLEPFITRTKRGKISIKK